MLVCIDWKSVPDVISKEQFYKLCHISKSTALYLLSSGTVPCRCSGKATHSYQIKKEDVKKYLHNRGIYPENYMAPPGWYKEKRADTSFAVKYNSKMLKLLHEFYSSLLSEYPDVLSVKLIASITGYNKSTINTWCHLGYLQSFKKGNKNFIPKIYLINYFCSQYFRSIIKKTKWHISSLREFNRLSKATG